MLNFLLCTAKASGVFVSLERASLDVSFENDSHCVVWLLQRYAFSAAARRGMCLGVFVQAAPGGANKFENNSHSALCAVLGCPVFWPHISVVSVSKEEKRLL